MRRMRVPRAIVPVRLAHWRSELSVLVFYDFPAHALDDTACGDRALPGVTKRDWLSRKLAQLTSVVEHVDHAGAGRYLLLIGQAATDAVAWRYSIWESAGFGTPHPLCGAASAVE